jgi:hypothetical protein
MRSRSGEFMRSRPKGQSSQAAAPIPQSGMDADAIRPAAREAPPWSGTLGLAFRAGERLRAESARLTELESRTRELHRAFMHERQTATGRLNEIRARADAADMWVTEAENEVGRVGASVADATARLAATEERVREARARARDAELWLRRIHSAIEAPPVTGGPSPGGEAAQVFAGAAERPPPAGQGASPPA